MSSQADLDTVTACQYDIVADDTSVTLTMILDSRALHKYSTLADNLNSAIS